MNKAGKLAIFGALALAMATSIPALARGGYHGGRGYHGGGHYHSRVSVGIGIGFPAFYYGYPGWGYGYYPYAPAYYPLAYYPPAYYPVDYSPPVYVERGDAYTPPEQAPGYWYYCAGAQAYYPYVRQCAGGWQRVPPRPQE